MKDFVDSPIIWNISVGFTKNFAHPPQFVKNASKMDEETERQTNEQSLEIEKSVIEEDNEVRRI